MTTTRINHTGHDHPNTTAARTACRRTMTAAPTYRATGRVVECTDLRLGDIIRVTFMDNPGGGRWSQFAEIVRVTNLGTQDGKYMPGFAFVVLTTDHPIANVGRTVSSDETRPWDEFEIWAA